MGIWAVDRGGALQLIAREGGTLVVNGASRKVAALEFLPAVPVVGAATRGFNEDGQLVFRATLKGRVGALFRVNR